jgi:Ca-activated chloride channel family protein
MHFAHPAFLWGLLLLPALAAYDHAFGLRAKARFRFSSLELLGRPPARRRDGLLVLSALRLAALAMLFLALARPQEGQTSSEAVTPATDILLCVDTSGSMEALDFKPRNRLDAAKDVIREFIKNRTHDRIGLVVFSGLAFTQCPLTTDYGAVLGFLDNVRIGMIQEDGTAIGDAVGVCLARLKGSEAKSKVIVLLTDGRNNRGTLDPLTAAKAAASFGVKIYCVGAGVPGEALYPVQDPVFGTRYVRVPEDLDEGTLRAIAETTRGLYFRAKDFESLKKIYKEIDRLEKTDVKVRTFTDYRDLYAPLLWAALILFLLEAALSATALRRLP